MSADANIPARKRRTSFAHHVAFETALRASTLPSAQRLVLWALSTHARYRLGYGIAWPSVKTIARETGLSRATAQRAIADLRGTWLEVWSCSGEGIQTSNSYVLRRPDLESPSAKLVNWLRRQRDGVAHHMTGNS